MPNYPCAITLAVTCRNTLIDPTIVICYNYNKDRYYTLSCPQPKNTGNIKKIEEGEISNKSEKEEP